ncbi:hypothetical protein I3842_13G166100 [Carya illinoinensis]|uniref:Uncharacterized protein n=1 Tax=Carya illinoinensis TaxID=32201 RepID=A0A922DEH3_CARIL|nr:hypothetical protein I3842_13G166100 [Carya illinoinensis]
MVLFLLILFHLNNFTITYCNPLCVCVYMVLFVLILFNKRVTQLICKFAYSTHNLCTKSPGYQNLASVTPTKASQTTK